MADSPQTDPPPPRRRFIDERGRIRVRGSLAIGILASLAVIYFLSWAQEIVMPVVFALVIYLLFMAPIRLLARKGIPPAVVAPVIVFGLAGAGLFGGATLAGPVGEWVERIPNSTLAIERKLHILRRPVEQMKEASEKVSKMTDVDDQKPGDPQEVVVKKPGLIGTLIGTMRDVAIQAAVILVLSMFLMAGGDVLREKLVQSVTRFGDKRRIYEMAVDIEHAVSGYLLTITLINIGLGTVVGLGLWAIGLPNPLVFGVMAGMLNFIPYLGNLVGAAIVFAVALISFETLGHAAMAPAIYLAASTIEGNFITPSILGRRLQVSAAFVFFGVIAGAWLWGVPGAFLAVPVLVTLKAVADRAENLGWLSNMLTRQRDKLPEGEHHEHGENGRARHAHANHIRSGASAQPSE